MRINRVKLILTSTLLWFAFGLNAQSGEYITVRDMETWSSINLAFKANKKLKFGLEQQLRMEDNSSNIQQYFTQSYAQYKLSKALGIGAEGRFIRNNDDEGKVQGYENHFRWAFNASYRHKLKRLDLKYRLQYQNKNELGVSKAEGDIPIKKIRLKVEAGYNIPKWKLDPRISGELFRNIGYTNEFSKIRGTIGTKYSIKNAGDISLFFRMERELNQTYPQTTHIIGFNYTYTIKRKKK